MVVLTSLKIHWISVEDDENVRVSDGHTSCKLERRVYPHPAGEIWWIASSPADSNQLATVFNAGSLYQA